eukprot:jgi/Hompol1/3500/HPOL_006572-RA
MAFYTWPLLSLVPPSLMFLGGTWLSRGVVTTTSICGGYALAAARQSLIADYLHLVRTNRIFVSVRNLSLTASAIYYACTLLLPRLFMLLYQVHTRLSFGVGTAFAFAAMSSLTVVFAFFGILCIQIVAWNVTGAVHTGAKAVVGCVLNTGEGTSASSPSAVTSNRNRVEEQVFPPPSPVIPDLASMDPPAIHKARFPSARDALRKPRISAYPSTIGKRSGATFSGIGSDSSVY